MFMKRRVLRAGRDGRSVSLACR